MKGFVLTATHISYNDSFAVQFIVYMYIVGCTICCHTKPLHSLNKQAWWLDPRQLSVLVVLTSTQITLF